MVRSLFLVMAAAAAVILAATAGAAPTPGTIAAPTETKLIATPHTAGTKLGYRVALDGNYAVGSSDVALTSAGAVYVWRRDVSTTPASWSQVAYLTGEAVHHRFGSGIAIHQDLLLVGAFGNPTARAYLYRRTSGTTTWELEEHLEPDGLTGVSGAAVDYGFSVAVTGSHALVGARYAGVGGIVYAFRYVSGSWVEQAPLIAGDAGSGDEFGSSVAVAGDRAIIGAPDDDDGSPDSGAVYFFHFDEVNGWVEVAKLKNANVESGALVGFAVAMSEDGQTAIQSNWAGGGPGEPIYSGQADVYDFSGGAWSHTVRLDASLAVARDVLGVSCDISGDFIILGAEGVDDGGSYSGAVYFWKKIAGEWTELLPRIRASDTTGGDEFGTASAISGGLAIVGAWEDDVAGGDAGRVYAFEATCDPDLGDGFYCPIDGSGAAACPDTSASYCTGYNEDGGVTQDPHIKGFLGQQFIVDGAATGDNQVYNMISSPWLQYNARFAATKFMHGTDDHQVPATQTTEIGFSFKNGKRVRMSLPHSFSGSLMNVVVEVDGERLPTNRQIDPIELAPGVTLSYALRSSHEVRIVAPRFSITVDARKYMFPHLDCDVKLIDWTETDKLHGLLGQTAHADKAQTAEDEAKGEVLADVFWPWFLDGELKDYHVEGDDVFGTGFVFNKF